MSSVEAGVRRAGALVAIAMASVLVLLLLVPKVAGSKHCVLAAYVVLMLGCGAVLLSPAHGAVADLARRAAREIHGALGRAAAQIWPAATVARVLETNPCGSGSASASSPSGARATSSRAEAAAAVRRAGALAALGAASVLLVLAPAPAVEEQLKRRALLLAAYAVLLLGCGAVLLSPARRAVADLPRRLASQTAAKKIRARADTVARWAGFACVAFCYAAADVRAAPEKVDNGLLLLFLMFVAGVWTVSLSVLAARDPPPLPLWLARPPPPPPAAAEEGHDGGEVNITVPSTASGTAVASKII